MKPKVAKIGPRKLLGETSSHQFSSQDVAKIAPRKLSGCNLQPRDVKMKPKMWPR